MKKRDVFLIITAIILISLAYGCKPRTPSVEPEKGAPEEIYKGYTGLEMSFMKNLPPDKLYDTVPLDIILELKNTGVYDLTGRCELYLHGYDENIITGLLKTESCGELEPKTQYNPEGGRDTQQFYTTNIYLPQEIDSLPQTFVVTACYRYQTIANPVVCIDPHLFEPFPIERACQVKDVTLSGGQGAPVSVDKVEVEMMKGKVLFRISISNRGAATTKTTVFGSRKVEQTGRRGTVLSTYTSVIDDCPFHLDYNDFNIVDYWVDMTGGSLLKCSPEIDGDYKIRLVDGKGTIYCYFNIYGESAYTTPLNIQLDYNYMESISKQVEIIKTP
jgi:hypothetical protein